MSRPDAENRPTPPVERLALRLDEVATALGLSRRSVERLRATGAFPKPDRVVGRMGLWSVATLEEWLSKGSR